MSKKGIDRGKKDKLGFKQDDDVETLLSQAEDDVLLKLSINSHTTHDNNDNSLDSELQRRFKALKKPVSLTNKNNNSMEKRVAKDGDVFARFVALKGSDSAMEGTSQFVVLPSDVVDGASNYPLDDDEDEVEKIMRWATDAARLDPSDDVDADVDSDLSISSDDDEEEEDIRRKDSALKKEMKK